MNKEELFYSADDISRILNVSKASAYKIIKTLNEELKAKNYLVISGRVSKTYFHKRCLFEEVS